MKSTEPEQRRPDRRLSMDPREDRVLALSLAYLNAGLSADEAIDEAIADCQCVFADDWKTAALQS